MAQKKKIPGPRLHRLKWVDRRRSALGWLKILRSIPPTRRASAYRKRYGVDWATTIRELKAIGLPLNSSRTLQLLAIVEGQRRKRSRQIDTSDSDATYAYIAGYTPNGVPFGVTWEEMRRQSLLKLLARDELGNPIFDENRSLLACQIQPPSESVCWENLPWPDPF